MTTMSDDGDRTCPLCAEEMDLTDQQLKPCKCGYEICVWCWHHIMEMAEKDDTEGRCPACRTPYDKKRIVGTASSCEWVVADVNAERRHKSQKAKPKSLAEARKHLTSVRVVQRNLVYIIGLPSNLSDESLLERKEYFGQYGKVLKVSISRPAAGAAAQQASNTNTFSVYITYAREDEAIRCIQAVHNFVLDGKTLRACFGTTKYCHAWLRNMPCSNPDCLYLHDIGSQEDSFTKDEIISAYTRSRVPQIAMNNLQRRSGNVLPSPVDDFSSCTVVSGNKTIVKSNGNNSTSHAKSSNNDTGKSTILPAAASWGTRASNCRPYSQTTAKQKIDIQDSSSINVGAKQTSAWHDDDIPASRIPEGRHAVHMDGFSRTWGSSKLGVMEDNQITGMDVSSEIFQVDDFTSGGSAWDDDLDLASKIGGERHMVLMNGRYRPSEPSGSSGVQDSGTSGSDMALRTNSDASHSLPSSVSYPSGPLASASEVKEAGVTVNGNDTSIVNGTSPETLGRHFIGSGDDEASDSSTSANGSMQSLCLDMSSVNIDRHIGLGSPNMDEHQSSVPNLRLTSMPENLNSRLQQCYGDNEVEDFNLVGLTQSSLFSSEQASRGLSSLSSESHKQVFCSTGSEKEGPRLVDDHRNKLSDATNQTSSSSYLNYSVSASNHSSGCSWNNVGGSLLSSGNGHSWTMAKDVDKALLPPRENESVLFNKQDSLPNISKAANASKFAEKKLTDEKVKCSERFGGNANTDNSVSVDNGESSIISNILSLKFDSWDDSLSATNDLAKLLGESNKQDSSLLFSSSRKSPNCNQSRFSFARQENPANLLETSLREVGHTQNYFSTLQDSYEVVSQNGSQTGSFESSNANISCNPVVSSHRHPGVSRAKVSAPPGFSLPSKAPPPGFSFPDRYDQTYAQAYSDNNLQSSSSLDNQYQVQQSDSLADVEFIDPAILAVGRERLPLGANSSGVGFRSAFPPQLSTPETADPRIQLLMQQSIAASQNQRVPGPIGDRFLPLNNSHTASRFLAQNQSSLSPFAQLPLQYPGYSRISTNQWNDVHVVNDVGMTEILRNERFGLNSYYTGNEELKIHMASAADIYNRAFGM